MAIVHKPTEVKSHLDTYTVYLENAQYRDIACIAALFIDGLEYSINDEIADSAIKEEYLSFNKECKKNNFYNYGSGAAFAGRFGS